MNQTKANIAKVSFIIRQETLLLPPTKVKADFPSLSTINTDDDKKKKKQARGSILLFEEKKEVIYHFSRSVYRKIFALGLKNVSEPAASGHF